MFISRAGCLLPLLIVLNLIFGWIFFKPGTWLLVELILILLLALNSYFLAKKISSFPRRQADVIDVKGEVVGDKEQIEKT
jgi:hypothetical protein